MDLLKSLVVLSEKAARVARLIRKDEHLFQMLIEQKNSEEANPRFVQDFKTLADVLIQQMIKYFLELQFPGIAERVRGEENNTFCNTLGDKITVVIKDTPEETGVCLEKVLNGDKLAASILAEEVHSSIDLQEVNTREIPECNCDLDVDKVGIWIDPIDSTAEYINASSNDEECGLSCVTILIGVYDIHSGEAVMGVVNQPFFEILENSWKGECSWGICYNSIRLNSIESSSLRSHCVYLSSTEEDDVKSKLQEKGYELKEAPGAGNKILKVIKNQGDCYVLSKSTTYKWDTCGPQAILRALGGDIVDYSEAIRNDVVSVKYPHDIDCQTGTCNKGGLIAYRIPEVLNDFVEKI